MIRILLAVVIVVLGAPGVLSQEHVAAKAKKASAKTTPAFHIYMPAELTWTNAPPALPAGAKIAVLSGDPMKPGPFTMRLSVPDGYRVPPHSHGNDEQVTVISGTFYVGMGDKFDESAGRELPAGAFAFMQKGMRHFAWVKGDTVVQINAVGPWSINYVNPADDPRKTAKSAVGKKQ